MEKDSTAHLMPQRLDCDTATTNEVFKIWPTDHKHHQDARCSSAGQQTLEVGSKERVEKYSAFFFSFWFCMNLDTVENVCFFFLIFIIKYTLTR